MSNATWRCPPAQYTTQQVRRLVNGLSFRQLDYLARRGVCRPSIKDTSGSGNTRVWSPQDVVAFRVIALISKDNGWDLSAGIPGYLTDAVDLIQHAELDGLAGYALLVSRGTTLVLPITEAAWAAATAHNLVTVVPLDQCLAGLVEQDQVA